MQQHILAVIRLLLRFGADVNVRGQVRRPLLCNSAAIVQA
jgi:hypothetical protein